MWDTLLIPCLITCTAILLFSILYLLSKTVCSVVIFAIGVNRVCIVMVV